MSALYDILALLKADRDAAKIRAAAKGGGVTFECGRVHGLNLAIAHVENVIASEREDEQEARYLAALRNAERSEMGWPWNNEPWDGR